MNSTGDSSATNALFKFYAQAKNKEEAESLIGYIDSVFSVKIKGTMKDFVTKDFLRAELSEIRTEMRTGFSDVRAAMSRHSENQTNRFNGMMLKMLLGILIPIITMMLALYFKI